MNEAPFDQYLRQVGLEDEIVPCTDGSAAPKDQTSHKSSKLFWSKVALAASTIALFYSAVPWKLKSATSTVMIALAIPLLYSPGNVRCPVVKKSGTVVQDAWEKTRPVLAGYVLYLRQVDVVARGYRIRSNQEISSWTLDSMLKQDQRQQVIRSLSSICRTALQVLNDANIEATVTCLIANAQETCKLALIQELFEGCNVLVSEIISLETARGFAEEHGLEDLKMVMERVREELMEAAPYKSKSSAVQPAGCANAPSVMAKNPSQLLEEHLYTMLTKVHLHNSEPGHYPDLPQSLKLDMEYLQVLFSQTKANPEPAETQDAPVKSTLELPTDAQLPSPQKPIEIADDAVSLQVPGYILESAVAEHCGPEFANSKKSRADRIKERAKDRNRESARRSQALSSSIFIDELTQVVNGRTRSWEQSATLLGPPSQ